MTFKELLNLGGFYQTPATHAMDRYHHEHGWHGSKSKGGSGAALSALTLLAFMFLLNVMQQSLIDNNSTVTTTATTVFLRNIEEPISLTSRVDDQNFEEGVTEDAIKNEPQKEISYVKITN